MSRNTAEDFDVREGEQGPALPTREEVAMREDDLLAGLFAAEAENSTEGEVKKRLYVNRGGKTYFEVDIRPLTELELMACRKRATRYAENPAGKRLPKIEMETNYALLRSLKIYTATTDEYKKKLWDNPATLSRFELLEGHDVIDRVFFAGEKDAILDKVDALSGFETTDLETYAKN